jgi:hypothetical protein
MIDPSRLDETERPTLNSFLWTMSKCNWYKNKQQDEIHNLLKNYE